MSTSTKTCGVKFVGAKRATETLELQPGTTVADVLAKLNLGGGYQLSPSTSPERVFRGTDNLYALIEDGDLIYCSALVDAGVWG